MIYQNLQTKTQQRWRFFLRIGDSSNSKGHCLDGSHRRGCHSHFPKQGPLFWSLYTISYFHGTLIWKFPFRCESMWFRCHKNQFWGTFPCFSETNTIHVNHWFHPLDQKVCEEGPDFIRARRGGPNVFIPDESDEIPVVPVGWGDGMFFVADWWDVRLLGKHVWKNGQLKWLFCCYLF